MPPTPLPVVPPPTTAPALLPQHPLLGTTSTTNPTTRSTTHPSAPFPAAPVQLFPKNNTRRYCTEI